MRGPSFRKIESISEAFDSVVMLTWSNWKTEPRSNRYHYATRFAQHMPVFFVQPDSTDKTVTIETIDGIHIVHCSEIYGAEQTMALREALFSRGVRSPILWIYNAFFEHYIRRSSARLKIFHATEDYITVDSDFAIAGSEAGSAVKRILPHIDCLIGVSEAVTRVYVERGRFRGHAVTLRNGCDFTFWESSGAAKYEPPADGGRVALYQGGLNRRLDFDLLQELARSMPHWQFWFCGRSDDSEGWRRLAAEPNVRYFGEVDATGIANLARHALVGLMPFKKYKLIYNSLPLKAYEYVGCGLPVVTIPIESLSNDTDLFRPAEGADQFRSAIEAVAGQRIDRAALARRRDAARRESYDQRFEALQGIILDQLAAPATNASLNVAILFDDQSTKVKTIREHIDAFQKYSRHVCEFMPATGIINGDIGRISWDHFDAIIVHYSIRVSIENHLDRSIAETIARFDGAKILFIQDEYENTECAREWIERLGIDAVFTTVNEVELEKAYAYRRFPRVDFIQTLTGYMPDDPELDKYALPLRDRKILIGYRGRKLPYQYGELGQEKYRIGVEAKRRAEEQRLPVDIEVDDTRRIYGNDWYRFLGSCRATLGTESGANIFDFDGSLRRAAENNANITFLEFADKYLQGREGEIIMNQISPKIFEAIRLRTALILFEGEYSGVVKPNIHYIPLMKDFSNFDEVVRKITDDSFVSALTERAFADIVASGRYSASKFVAGVDAYLSARVPRGPKARLVAMTVCADFGEERQLINAFGNAISPTREAVDRQTIVDIAQRVTKDIAATSSNSRRRANQLTSTLRRVWRLIPTGVRSRLAREIARINIATIDKNASPGLVASVWSLAPLRLRLWLFRKLPSP
ncbi:MAG: glycosyltransferase [Methylobacteriaceae bacterium]|nr:glycosyltransferase [Methylobacteriaceae bacterium]